MAAIFRVCLAIVCATMLASQAAAHCPNFCSGHGSCHPVNKCTCWSRWSGGDCSMRKCPVSYAWTDEAIATDLAHQKAVCSNRGVCDTKTGLCQCDQNFEGLACQRKGCPNDCNGHGTCRNMKFHARTRSQGDGLLVLRYDNNWDAEKIYGCECDIDYQGYDCSWRVCPSGDDPMTSDQRDETQAFKCLEDPTTSGTFTLTFRGETTEPINYNDAAERVETLLEALTSVYDVDVRFYGVDVNGDGILTVCSNDPLYPNAVVVTFERNFGDLPHLLSLNPVTLTHPRDNMEFAYDGEEMEGFTTETGSKEDKPCSGRGLCDVATGLCHCYTGYVTSDGRGEIGDRGDCGHANEAITSCPGATECSGHGVCSDHPFYLCTCAEGWMGGDCNERVCPFMEAWFDLPYDPVNDPPTENDRAHNLAECSNMGVCNRETGECQCHPGFEGAACERLSCPLVRGLSCSGHGRCLNMFQLAEIAEINGDATDYTYGHTPNDPQTWDYNKVYGCKCDEGFESYDCSQRSCPTGDDLTTDGLKELQLFKCTSADIGNGGFKLMFRQQVTETISDQATASELEEALEFLTSIDDVTILFSVPAAGICESDNVISVTFESELGDVPPMTAPADDLDQVTVTFYTDGADVDNIYSFTGTMENSECSERGLCNHATGECECFVGFGSSDSNGNSGGRGDCGHRIPVIPVIPEYSRKLADQNTLEPFDVFT